MNDYEQYQDNQRNMRQLIADGLANSQIFQEIWQASENLKNNHLGIPPTCTPQVAVVVPVKSDLE